MLSLDKKIFEFSVTNRVLFDIVKSNENLLNYVKSKYENNNYNNVLIKSIEKVSINNIYMVSEDGYECANICVICDVLIDNLQANDLIMIDVKNYELVSREDNSSNSRYVIYKNEYEIIEIQNLIYNYKTPCAIVKSVEYIINSPIRIIQSILFLNPLQIFAEKYIYFVEEEHTTGNSILQELQDKLLAINKQILIDFEYSSTILLPSLDNIYLYYPIKNKFIVDLDSNQLHTARQTIGDFIKLYYFIIKWMYNFFVFAQEIFEKNIEEYNIILKNYRSFTVTALPR